MQVNLCIRITDIVVKELAVGGWVKQGKYWGSYYEHDKNQRGIQSPGSKFSCFLSSPIKLKIV